MLDIMAALWFRQLRRYARAKARIIATIAQPLLYLLAMGFGFAPVFAKAGHGDYIQFLSPGVIGSGILFNSIFAGTDLLWDRQFGFIKETLVAPVPRLVVMLGRALGDATVSVLQGVLIGFVCLAVGFRPHDAGLIPLAILFAVLIALVFTLIGTAIGALLTDFQGLQMIMNFLVMPVYFVSGALFPLDGLPRTFRIVALCDPLSYGIDGLRGALTGHWSIGGGIDLIVLSVVTTLALIAASVSFSRIQP